MVEKFSFRSQTRLQLVLEALLLVLILVLVWWFTRTPKPVFSGEQAFAYVHTQVDFGPRIPGSDGHHAALQWMLGELEPYADAVDTQPFTYVDAHDSTKVWEGTNVVASFNLDPAGARRVMLSAHWDTRPVADHDPDPEQRTEPVPGANDGASGVAVLLEMARLMSHNQPDIGVDIVLFDMEDIGDDVGPEPDSSVVANPFALGSRQFVEDNPRYRPEYGILLDMVCDANLRIPKEVYSQTHAAHIVDKVWEAAANVGAEAFLDEAGGPVADDHVAFLQKGIPVIDLIHYPFPESWHTTNDLPSSCSAQSLQQIGDVLVEVIYNE